MLQTEKGDKTLDNKGDRAEIKEKDRDEATDEVRGEEPDVVTGDLLSLGVEPSSKNTVTNGVKEIQGGTARMKLVQELPSWIPLVSMLINHMERQNQRHEEETRLFKTQETG